MSDIDKEILAAEDALVQAVVAARKIMSKNTGITANDISGDAAKFTLDFMSLAAPLLTKPGGSKVTVSQMKAYLRRAKEILDKQIIQPPPVVEPPRECTYRAIEANGGKMPEKPEDTCAVECKVHGKGIIEAAPRLPVDFFIDAYDFTGRKRKVGGDAFFVAIRGASTVRARIEDKGDGTYRVEWKPPQSGSYAIAISYFGMPLQGSPYKLHVSDPSAYAPNCRALGDALTMAVARNVQSFFVQFKDRLGNVAHAVDLDVYVEPMPIEGLAAGTVANPDLLTKLPEPPPVVEAKSGLESPKRDSKKVGDKGAKKEEGDKEGGAKKDGGATNRKATDEGASKEGRKEGSKPQPAAPAPPSSALKEGSKPQPSSAPAPNKKEVGKPQPTAATSTPLPDNKEGSKPQPAATAPPSEKKEGDKPKPVEKKEGSGSKGGGPSGKGGKAQPVVAPPPPPPEAPKPPPFLGWNEPEMIEGGAEGSQRVTRKRTIRVRVEGMPLVMREKEDLESEILGLLLPGQMVTVIQETITAGKVRAMVALESISRMPEAGAYPESFASPRRPSSPGRSPTGASATLSLQGAQHPTQLTGDAHAGESPDEGSAQELEAAVKAAGVRGLTPVGFASHAEIESTVAKLGVDALAGKVAWVTLVKDGRKLVTSRLRESASTRQLHQQQFLRRVTNDFEPPPEPPPDPNAEPDPLAMNLTTQEKDAYRRRSRKRGVSLEKSSDPTGIGFAFGGIYPGTLHAHGALVEQHSVSYSVGLVGPYLLHVRLRQQAVALPGSPFLLIVRPGKAHAASTRLPKTVVVGGVGMAAGFGCGIAISTADIMGNKCISGGAIVTGDCFNADGSRCDSVQTTVRDNGDGTYYLHWNSTQAGTYNAAIKIYGEQILGTSQQITLKSTTPDMLKSQISGVGLSRATAGADTKFQIKFFDQYGNSALLDGKQNKIGMALLKAGEKIKDEKSKPYLHTMACIDEEEGLYEFSFIPFKDGTFDLHVWSETTYQGTKKSEISLAQDRLPLPSSPFHLVISPGLAGAKCSSVDGYTKESKNLDKKGKVVNADNSCIVAGDAVVFRPQICDDLGNVASLGEGMLDVEIEYPAGNKDNLSNTNALKFTTLVKGGITTHDIRHDATHAGEHFVRLKLNGHEISGSPVHFYVEPAEAEVKQCKLIPPSEPLLYSNKMATIVLKTYDRFGNPLTKGGLAGSARLQLVKSGVSDLTTLMPNNNSVEVVDQNNGEYNVNVTLIKITATVRVIINMDKNIPAGGGELAPVQLSFILSEADAPPQASSSQIGLPLELGEAGRKLQKAGQEIVSMIQVAKEGDDVRPKNAVAVAIDAFAAAGQAKAKKDKAK